MNVNIYDINFDEWNIYEIKKGPHANRIIYINKTQNKFMKIWEEDYMWKKNFIYAYNKKYYDNISTLINIIIDKNDIVGYITQKLDIINSDYETNIDNLLIKLYNKILLNGLIHIDITKSNVGKYENNYYLFDLEPVILIDEIDKYYNCLKYCPDNYYKNCINLIKNKLSYYSYMDKLKIYHNFRVPDNKSPNYNNEPTRDYLEKTLLPSLNGSIFYIGVNYYNEFYYKLVKNPELFETIDFIEDRVQFGSPYTHYCGDILNFNINKTYDNVISFGLLGHKDDWDIIKTDEGIKKYINIVSNLVNKNGYLLLGPACSQTEFNIEYWDNIYNTELQKYKSIKKQRMGINYVWIGQKID